MHARRLLLAWMALLSAQACSTLPPPPVRPTQALQTRPGLASDPVPSFRLRPGDHLAITIDSLASTTDTAGDSTDEHSMEPLVVDANGRFYVPGLGSIQAQDRSLRDAEAAITEIARQQDRFATVHLALREDAGQRVSVLGAVVRQGTIHLTAGARIADVIAAAGGPLTAPSRVTGASLSLADMASAVVVRAGKPLPIDLARALRGDRAHNVYAYPGDHIYVPLAGNTSVRVMGQVGAPAVFAPYPGLRLTEALAIAGGITTDGDKSDIRVVRGSIERPLVYSADVAAIVDGSASDVELLPGDLLFVTDDPSEDVREVISIVAPILGLATSAALTTFLLVN